VPAEDLLDEIGVSGSAYAAQVGGGPGVGFNQDRPVTPASVMKISVALTVENLIAEGAVAADAPRRLPAERRTPGPVGISLMHDDVTMSVRDLVVAMLTISDNVATDELIAIAGIDAINQTTKALGLAGTQLLSDIGTMLGEIAKELGFADFATLVAHDPTAGPPSDEEIHRLLVASTAMDPAIGTHTTAADTVTLLQAIWTDRAAPAEACRSIRRSMSRQLTKHRIAAGFAPPATVSAKSGALLGVVRNEAGVVSYPDESAYAVAVFTRRGLDRTTDPTLIDSTIGQVARTLVDQLRGSTTPA
jgi:beta-lactamase class A